MIAAAAPTLDGSNAIQILLLLGGITLVPALLFTLTGFSRILIVLGFIRSGLGTPTAPPNQVLIGIAFVVRGVLSVVRGLQLRHAVAA